MAGTGFWRDIEQVTDGDPTQYQRVGGTVIVPSVHALAERAQTSEEFGINTEDTNYGRIGKSPDFTAAVNQLTGKNLDVSSALTALKKAQEQAEQAPVEIPENPQSPRTDASLSPRRARRKAPTKMEQVSEESVKKSIVVWHTDYGDFSSAYDQVLVGERCLILVFGPDAANVFMPKEASKETPFMYHIEFNGIHYKGMYVGFKACDQGKTYLVVPVSLYK